MMPGLARDKYFITRHLQRKHRDAGNAFSVYYEVASAPPCLCGEILFGGGHAGDTDEISRYRYKAFE